MRTTIELPDDLLKRAKSASALKGQSLKDFFIEAVEQKLTPAPIKRRLELPAIGDPNGPRVHVTREQIEEAAFPIQHYLDETLRSRR